MKNFFYCFLFSVIIFQANAQQPWIESASCDTWGIPQWKPFDSFPRSIATTPEEYLNYDKHFDVVYVTPGRMSVYFVGDEQVLRWKMRTGAIAYHLKVTNMFDDVLYETTIKECTQLIHTKDLMLKGGEKSLVVSIIPTNEKDQGMSRLEDKFLLRPFEKSKQDQLLAELKTCKDWLCKVELLQKNGALLDAMTVLELEKIKDPQNTSLVKKYWELASDARFEAVRMGVDR